VYYESDRFFLQREYTMFSYINNGRRFDNSTGSVTNADLALLGGVSANTASTTVARDGLKAIKATTVEADTFTVTEAASLSISAPAKPITITSGGDVTFSSGVYNLVAATPPTLPSHLVNKAYADALAGGMTWKNACVAKTNTNLQAFTASGTQEFRTLTANANGALSVDSLAIAVGDRVLCDLQIGVECGIYVCTNAGSAGTKWVLVRAVDCNNNPAGEVIQGIATSITGGLNYANRQYILTTANPIILGTTVQSWVQFSAGQVTMSGDVTSASNTSVVSFVGGISASSVATSVGLTAAATNLSTASTIVKRDVGGNAAIATLTTSGILKTTSLLPLLTSDSISYNTFIGLAGITSATGQYNTAIGVNAFQYGTGSTNVAIGVASLQSSNVTAASNVAVGVNAMAATTSGAVNTAVGTNSLFGNTTGDDNIGIGQHANDANTTGTRNVAIGSISGVTSGALTNTVAIGYNATVAASNTIQLGNASITNVKTSGALTCAAITGSGLATLNSASVTGALSIGGNMTCTGSITGKKAATFQGSNITPSDANSGTQYFATAAITVTLPTSAVAGTYFHFIASSSGVIIQRGGTNTIYGYSMSSAGVWALLTSATSITTAQGGSTCTLTSDGTNWVLSACAGWA
jgi:hypothetical protein